MKLNFNNIIDSVSNKVNNFLSEDSSFTIKEKEKKVEVPKEKVDNPYIFNFKDKIIYDENAPVIQGNVTEYMAMCPYISRSFAKMIDQMFPMDEYVLYIVDFMQKYNNREYLMILTDKKIMLMDMDKYINFNYEDIKTFSLTGKSLMTQNVNFNGINIGLNLTYKDFQVVYNIITNSDYRNRYILFKTQYLCGIKPNYQQINEIGSGVSIDDNMVVVFHDKKVKNYLAKYDDIYNYELMEDNTPVLQKKLMNKSNAIKNVKKECYKMTLRVTLNSNQYFEIRILEPTTFNNAYSHKNKEYIAAYSFAKEIINKLDSLYVIKY